MAWATLDDNFPHHPKTIGAGPLAAYLFVCGLCYCRKYHTGGFIKAAVVTTLGASTTPKKLITALMAQGLWTRVDGGYQIHDYDEMYPGDADEKAMSEETRQKKREAGRKGGIASWRARSASSTVEADGEAQSEARIQQLASNDASNGASTSAEALSFPFQYVRTVEERTQVPVPTREGVRVLSAPIITKRRRDAAWEGPRLWVPQRAFSDMAALLNRPDAEAVLLVWFEEISALWTTGAHADDQPGANMFEFWRARYNEQWPPTLAAKPDTRPQWVQDAEREKAAAKAQAGR